ncbi:hypothetical protein B0F90DRAFT_1747981 [Multifurca ochricompacta]|uniref:Uncharacterized protein n=1 Tax=Multifurca ochricompacta TaxID=376703 RepID=A0AAD4LZB6_9AGAM|nr:hypothetical protein B0F90DRAFT_1747981 [Multifurca ochricompacta]
MTFLDFVLFLILPFLTLITVARRWPILKATGSSNLHAPSVENGKPKSFRTDGDDNPNKDRRPGDWTAVDFVYPPVTSITEPLDQIPPRPYRPYKPGRYHVTMGIRPMEWDSWIELDRDFPAYYHLRAARLASPRGPKLLRTLPDRPKLVRGGADAARELVHELAEFLVARYPGVYRATRRAGVIVAVEVLPVGVTHDLETEDSMVVATMLQVIYLFIYLFSTTFLIFNFLIFRIQDDLAIMIEGADGQYYLQAGAILLGGSSSAVAPPPSFFLVR